MVSRHMKLQALLAGALVAAALFTACKKSPPANVAAVVNSRTITYAELDKTHQSQFASNSDGSSTDQVTAQKQIGRASCRERV